MYTFEYLYMNSDVAICTCICIYCITYRIRARQKMGWVWFLPMGLRTESLFFAIPAACWVGWRVFFLVGWFDVLSILAPLRLIHFHIHFWLAIYQKMFCYYWNYWFCIAWFFPKGFQNLAGILYVFFGIYTNFFHTQRSFYLNVYIVFIKSFYLNI